MISFPNAKINIGLQIVEKRPDGFHNIASCFYPVGWADVLEIIPSDVFGFSSSGIDIPGNADTNLCVKAYQLLKQDFDIPAVQIHLLKIVPIGAGLGGGSADAAFTLKMLNTIFELQLTTQDLEDYARRIGSDCAFFVQNKPMYCYEKGDKFMETDFCLSGKHIVLIYPNLHISTADAYAGVIPNSDTVNLVETMQRFPIGFRDNVKNDFEDGLFLKYPILSKIKTKLYDSGASYASLTGSGSTLYGIFDKSIDLQSDFSEYTVWQGELG